MKQLGAIEGEDYLFHKTMKAPEYGLRGGYITQKDYIVTIDMTKCYTRFMHTDKEIDRWSQTIGAIQGEDYVIHKFVKNLSEGSRPCKDYNDYLFVKNDENPLEF